MAFFDTPGDQFQLFFRILDGPSRVDSGNRLPEFDWIDFRTFLQMNGLTFKNIEEKDALMRDLLRHGVQSVNFTFYETEDYHDQFAGRTGDFQHNLSMADAANQAGLFVSVGVALTAENYMQMDDLYSKLESRGISNVRLFIPHEEGRGIFAGRITLLSERVQSA